MLKKVLISCLFVFCINNISAQIGGVVYQEFPVNGSTLNTYGTMDSNELGLDGVSVTITDASGNTTTQTTSGGGMWNDPVSNFPVRVEFTWTSLPYLESSIDGTGSNTSVQFISATSTTVNFGLHYPDDYHNSTVPNIMVPVFRDGDINSTNSSGLNTMSYFDYDDTGLTPPPTNVATHGETGALHGLAFDKIEQRMFASAFLKRHVDLGSEGLGGVYIFEDGGSGMDLTASFDLQGVTPSNSGTAIDFGSVIRVDSPGGDDNYLGGNSATRDMDAYGKVGRVGIGDIDISPDGKLYLVNLNETQKSIIVLDIKNATTATLNNGTSAILGPLTETYSLNSIDALLNCADSQDGGTAVSHTRPFALKIHNGKGYLGVVCDGGGDRKFDNDELSAFVLSFDPNNIAGGFNIEVEFPTGSFGYRGSALNNWRRWSHTWADTHTNNTGVVLSAPQPIIADIEFAEDGDMIIGFMDRFGHQIGSNNFEPVSGSTDLLFGLGFGDIIHVCKNGTSWEIEGMGTCPTLHTTPNNLLNDYGGFNGGAEGEYYNDAQGDLTNPSAGEAANGAMAKLMGSNQVVSTVMDPYQNGTTGDPAIYGSTGGVHWFNHTNGEWDNHLRLYELDGSNFYKSHGLGDIELLGPAAPIEIGNRVWEDTNDNGIQDPTEPGLDGVLVELLNSGGTVIASTNTANGGQYYFDETDGVDFETQYSIRVAISAADGASANNLTDVSDTNTGNGINDSDGTSDGTYSSVSFSTGLSGTNRHIYDFGFIPAPACTTPAAPVVSVTDNVCPSTTGTINIDTPCAAGSHIEYSIDSGVNWTTTQPTYTTSAFTFLSRCVDDGDATCFSTSDADSTNPTTCTAPSVCDTLIYYHFNDSGGSTILCPEIKNSCIVGVEGGYIESNMSTDENATPSDGDAIKCFGSWDPGWMYNNNRTDLEYNGLKDRDRYYQCGTEVGNTAVAADGEDDVFTFALTLDPNAMGSLSSLQFLAQPAIHPSDANKFEGPDSLYIFAYYYDDGGIVQRWDAPANRIYLGLEIDRNNLPPGQPTIKENLTQYDIDISDLSTTLNGLTTQLASRKVLFEFYAVYPAGTQPDNYGVMFLDDLTVCGSISCASSCTTPAAPVVSVTDNVCPSTTGTINIDTPCAAGSHIEYSFDGGVTWSQQQPAYSMDARTILSRCVDDNDPICFSTSDSDSTNPTTCPTPEPCNCTEYVYLNEVTNGGAIHKFAVNQDGSLAEISSPWFDNTLQGEQVTSPHGLGTDINGFMYIAETAPGNIRKFTCNGDILPESEFEVIAGGTNIASIGNVLYANVGGADPDGIFAYDLCAGTPLGYYCLNGMADPSNEPFGDSDWGFSIVNDSTFLVTDAYLSSDDNNLWVFHLNSSTLNPIGGSSPVCIDPLISQGDGTVNVGEQEMPGNNIYGVTMDDSGNIYIVEAVFSLVPSTPPSNSSRILKYDNTGAFVAATPFDTVEGDGGYFRATAIAWSATSGMLYVSTQSPLDDCISIIDPATMTYVGPAVPATGTGTDNAKGMAIKTECCPATTPQAVNVTTCAEVGDKIFIADLISDCAVCEGQWTQDAGCTGITFEPCDLSFTIDDLSASCCFTKSSDGSHSNSVCGAFDFQVCFTVASPAPPALSVTDNVCPSTTGTINIDTPCAAGSHIEYSFDGGVNWTTTQPTYGSSSITILSRCVDNSDATCFSTSDFADTNPTPCGGCTISNPGVVRTDCTTPGTVFFTLNPQGGASATYTVGSTTGTVSPSSSSYGQGTKFALTGYSGATATITIADSSDPSCSETFDIDLTTCNYVCNACSPVCTIIIDGVSASVCDPNTNTYDLDVTVEYVDPASGDIQIDVAGVSQTFTPDGSGTETFTVTGLPADGSTGVDVSTSFVNDGACRFTGTDLYNAPADCSGAPCPDPNCFDIIVTE